MRKFKYLAKLIIPSTCILALLSLVIGGAFGVLQMQTNSVENIFDLVYMDITVIEPGWDASLTDEEGRKVYTSGETFVKDPLVSNIGSRDVYTYISVFVPDNPNTEEDDTAFTYNYDDSSWFLLQEQPQHDVNDAYVGKTFYYGYKNVLKTGENTPPVFSEVTFMTYDINEENALEDKESVGEGEGSLILGKTFDIIVNGYAVTTDVDDINLGGVMGGGFRNKGVSSAWTLLVKDTLANLEEGAEAPSYTEVMPDENEFTVEFIGSNEELICTARIFSRDGDMLNLNQINDYIKGYNINSQFQDLNELYNCIVDENNENLFYEPAPLNEIADENNTGSFRIKVNTKYAYVYISLVAEGKTQQVITLQFENGEVISNETISTKLSEHIGQTITIPSPEINEIAAAGDTYNLSIDISAIINQ